MSDADLVFEGGGPLAPGPAIHTNDNNGSPGLLTWRAEQ